MIDTPTPSEPPQNDVRQRLLARVEEAVLGGDEEFALELLEKQGLVEPPDLVEYLCVKAKKEADPVGTRRWEDAARAYAGTLMDRKFSSDEIERMRRAMEDLDFQRIVDNEEEAEEPDIEAGGLSSEWDADEFRVTIDQSRIDELRTMPVFQQAEALALGKANYNGIRLDLAIDLIKRNVSRNLQVDMRLVIDWYVFCRAEALAAGTANYNGQRFDLAREEIHRFASSPAAERRMAQALDKHIFAHADALARGAANYNGPRLDLAQEVIGRFASSPDRKKEMLRRLGFM